LGERLRAVAENRTFLVIVGLNLCFRIILAVLVTALPFYAEYVLQVGGGQTSTLVTVFVVSYTIAMIVWQPVYKRFGTRRTVFISMSVFAVASLPAIVATTMLGAIFVVSLIGFGLGGPMIVGAQLLFAEMIDEDFVETGVRREGLYRGMLGFVYRLPPAFSGLLLGELLAWSGYNAALSPAEQPVIVATSIRYFIGLTPMIAAVIGAVLAYIYPLHGDYLEAIQSRAQELNAQFDE
jgi:GPH family glycoside/pentoside/hexuronide:cation symporter